MTKDCTQLFRVYAQGMDSSLATAEYLERENASAPWQTICTFEHVYIGRNGLGKEREGDKRTPIGEFRLSHFFCAHEDARLQVPYTIIDASHVWGGDTAHPEQYNQLVSDPDGKLNDTDNERLIRLLPAYNYLALIEYNYPHSVVGKGSAIFIHCTGHAEDGSLIPYTGGCVAMAEEDIRKLFCLLREDRHPMISLEAK